MFRKALQISLMLGLTASVLAAPPPGKGKPDKAGYADQGAPSAQAKGNEGKKGNKGDDAEDHNGWDEDRLRLYVRQQSYGGYDALPPGIRKNLARGKPLPPGLQTRAMPPELLRQLPVREGYEWRAAGRDVVLYSITTGVVDQVLRDIFD